MPRQNVSVHDQNGTGRSTSITRLRHALCVSSVATKSFIVSML
jgi:hypothetical protein